LLIKSQQMLIECHAREVQNAQEVDRLKAEQAKRHRCEDQRTDERSENERLKAAVTDIGVAHLAAQAEVERLGVALREIGVENERLQTSIASHSEQLREQVERATAAEDDIEHLRINLRDYRAKHPCSHEVMCWADEIAWKALERASEC
jgi:hypothetical protein